MLWWARPLPEADLRKMVDHSLNIGLYIVDDQTAAADTPPSYPMIGFARLVTDYVSFAYLTDVYILPEHQGKGLGKWMMECLDEVLKSWPGLRRTMLLTSDPNAVRLYEKMLGMEVAQPGKLLVMMKAGPAAPSH